MPSINYEQLYKEIETAFKKTVLWDDMVQCKENSPYHREDNVSIHTEMVLSEYWVLLENPWSLEDFICSIVLLFHDVGKPIAKERKWSSDRGYYFVFKGHEQISSRVFVDWVLSTSRIKTIFDKLGNDILFIIAWLIEYHRPWDIKDRQNILWTISKFIGNIEPFIDILLADTYGRIADDRIEGCKKAEEWCVRLRNEYFTKSYYLSFLNNNHRTNNTKTAYFLIGPSGSGKSTFRTSIGDDVNTFSLDDIRLELYGNDYGYAFQQSCKDKHFKAYWKNHLIELARKDKDLIIDNTNLLRESRGYILTELRNRDYRIVAIPFLTALQTNINRQSTRKDKAVPVKDVNRQYWSLQLPSLGEFDDIQLVVN